MNPFDKESKIRDRFQTTIPEVIRNKANIQIGDTLIWQYDEIRNEITVIMKPKSFTDALSGLGKNLFDSNTNPEKK